MKKLRRYQQHFFSVALLFIQFTQTTLGLDYLYRLVGKEVEIIHAVGESMLPTFETDSYFLSFSDDKSLESITYNTFITFNSNGKSYLKRVVAVGGDVVEIKDSTLLVNDKVVTESYIYESEWSVGEFDKIEWQQENRIVVPENHYFVLGDNRNNSEDSRSFGIRTVSKSDVTSVVKPLDTNVGKLLFDCQTRLFDSY